jgi:hypothetical protein
MKKARMKFISGSFFLLLACGALTSCSTEKIEKDGPIPEAQAARVEYKPEADDSGADRFPASARSDLSLFDGGYVRIFGSKACPESLKLNAHFRGRDIASVETSIPEYDLKVSSGPQMIGTKANCSKYQEDQLIDNYDKLVVTGKPRNDGDAEWEIIRSFTKTCSGNTTFAGFQVWKFSPKADGAHEVHYESIQGKGASCTYRKLANSY